MRLPVRSPTHDTETGHAASIGASFRTTRKQRLMTLPLQSASVSDAATRLLPRQLPLPRCGSTGHPENVPPANIRLSRWEPNRRGWSGSNLRKRKMGPVAARAECAERSFRILSGRVADDGLLKDTGLHIPRYYSGLRVANAGAVRSQTSLPSEPKSGGTYLATTSRYNNRCRLRARIDPSGADSRFRISSSNRFAVRSRNLFGAGKPYLRKFLAFTVTLRCRPAASRKRITLVLALSSRWTLDVFLTYTVPKTFHTS